MKTLATLFLAVLLGGCSVALQERLSTDTYWGTETVPHVSEHPIGVRDHFGYQKRLIVHNPLFQRIRVEIKCATMFMDDPTFEVPPRRVRFMLITGGKEHGQTCFLTHYEVVQ